MYIPGPVRSINPLDREQRQDGLFPFERSILGHLRARGWIRSPFSISLPYEIWVIILNLVLEPLIDPSLYCNPLAFPRYQFDLSHDEGLDRRDWTRVRLVCRAWRDILGPCPHMVMSQHTKAEENPANICVPQGTRSLVVGWGYHSPWILLKNLLANPGISNSIVSLWLGDIIGHNGSPAELLLLGNEINFASLRCLSLGHYRSTTQFFLPDYWERIGLKFPKLTSLTLRSSVPTSSGLVSLPGLQILDFHPGNWKDVMYDFPSLKHCSVHGVVWIDQVLRSCSQNLESLIFHRGGTLLSTQFWETYPRLQMLGITLFSDAFDVTNSPPPNHPLSHLQLIFPYSWKGDKAKAIKDVLPFFPYIKFLSIEEDIRLNKSDLGKYHDIQVLPVPNPRWIRMRKHWVIISIGDALIYCILLILGMIEVGTKYLIYFTRSRSRIQLGP
jgi:hypothetical protein